MPPASEKHKDRSGTKPHLADNSRGQVELLSENAAEVKRRKLYIVLLSFFDGIGLDRLPLGQLGYRTKSYLPWVVDEECKAFITSKYPHAVERGDFDKINVNAVWNDIHKLIDDHSFLLVTNGPP
jgi:hypothetical protein